MTAVYITIDTEYSAALAKAGRGLEENFARSIRGGTRGGRTAGIGHQMDVMDATCVKGTFFVDPMPALVYGEQAVRRIVEPVLERGHDVQLHIHTEWLEIAGSDNILGSVTGRNMTDFTRDDQHRMIAWASGQLVAAGAPRPTAFRAGNYGANDDTLRALAACGIRYDTSYVPGIARSACRIDLPRRTDRVIEHHGTLEVPVATLPSLKGLRHGQITALSASEMAAAIRYSVKRGHEMLNLVSHSFELMSRDRTRPNRILLQRFARLCRAIRSIRGASSETFASRPPQPGDRTGCTHMPVSEVRVASRMAEQLLSNTLYGAR